MRDWRQLRGLHRDWGVTRAEHKGSGKNAAVMGHLACKTPDGRQFSVGSGFSDAQRRMLLGW